MKKMIILILLIFSLILNVGLIYVLIMSERMNHSIEAALDKRGWIEMPESHRPDYWMLQGWTNSVSKQHIQYDVAFIGDSHIYNGDFQSFFPDTKIINLGVSGNTLKEMQRRIPTLVAASPNKVFIMAGANDLVLEDIDSFINDYSSFISRLKQNIPATAIYLQSILPMNSIAEHKQVDASKINKANERIKELCVQENIIYVDLWSLYAEYSLLPAEYSKDGLHLTPKGYTFWMEALKKYIQ